MPNHRFAAVVLSVLSCCALGARLTAQTYPTSAIYTHHESRSVSEWLERIDETKGRSVYAIWSIYYWGDRSPEVTDRLVHWIGATRSRRGWQALDTVLNAWRVPHEALTVGAYLGATTNGVVLPEALFSYPVSRLEVSDERALELLLSEDPEEVAAAATTLIVRGEHAVPALRVLLAHRDVLSQSVWPSGLLASVWRWAKDYAGRERVGEAGRLEVLHAIEAGDDETLQDLLRSLHGLLPAEASLLASLDGVAARGGEIGDAAWSALASASGIGYSKPDSLHGLRPFFSGTEPEAKWSAEAEIVLARALSSRLRQIAANPSPPDDERSSSKSWVQHAHAAVVRSEVVAEACAPYLRRLLTHQLQVEHEALRALCHIGDQSPEVREAYLAKLAGFRSWSSTRPVPCLQLHDRETLAALESLLENPEAVQWLAHPLRAAGLTNGEASPLVREYLDQLTRPQDWARVLRLGFRGPVAMKPDDTPAVRIHKLALNIATRREAGGGAELLISQFEETLREEYYGGPEGDWRAWGLNQARELGLYTPAIWAFAVDLLRDAESWGSLVGAAKGYVDAFPLSATQVAEVEAAERAFRTGQAFDVSRDSIRRLEALALRHPGGIQRIPELRTALYSGDHEQLDTLAREGHFAPRDEEYLLAVLARGSAQLRSWALGLVETHDLGSARLADAVRARRRDIDPQVAGRAEALIAARGW